MTDTTDSSTNDPISPLWTWPIEPDDSLRTSVLYFAEECLVVQKPAGLLTQAPAGIPSIESQARRFFKSLVRDRLGPGSDPAIVSNNIDASINIESDYVGVPHRLDRATSGALLLGQTKAVTRKLAAQFEKRTIKKIYWALLEGHPTELAGTWTNWMRKLPDRALSEITEPTDSAAQWAELDFKILGQDSQVCLVEIHLKTGRTHQIRLQASARGFPILGDAEYGAQFDFGTAFDDHRRRAIALHARTIDFWHPKLHRPVVVHAPVPSTWQDFASAHATKLLPLLCATPVA